MKLIVMFLCSALSMIMVHAMEKDRPIFFCDYKGTDIYVVRGYRGAIYEQDGKVDIIVVGQNEQKQLDRTAYFDNDNSIGSVVKKRLNAVCIMKKESDSSSNEDHDNPTQWIKHRDHNYVDKDMGSCVLAVLEPRVSNSWYGKKRENYFYDNLQGEDAIAKALKDLTLCYTNVLIKGIEELVLCKKKDKSIAIPSLSTTYPIPRKDACCTALAAVITYVKNNEKNSEKRYNKIILYVKKRFEFEMYKNILMNVV